MAKLKGFELKGVKNFRGHEGEPLQQGDIYYKGSKVGFYSQDSWGGCDNVSIDYDLPKELKEEVDDILSNYVTHFEYDNESFELKGDEYLFQDLLKIMEDEKNFKKYTKKWDCTHIGVVEVDLGQYQIVGGNSIEDIKESMKRNKIENKTYKIYNKLEDFIQN